VSVFIFLYAKSYAQQRVQFTQYMFNGLSINPAYAGVDEALSITFLNRNQWAGIEGSPTTQTLSGHTLFKREQIGIGLSLINDKIGVHKNFSALASTAYHLKVTSNGYLSMGIEAGINHKKSDYASLIGDSGYDPTLFNTAISQTFLDIGFGFYFRNPKFHIGFSMPEVAPQKLLIRDTIKIQLNKAYYLLFFKHHLTLDERLAFEPSLLVKYLPGVPLSFDLNASIIIREAVAIGLSYRKSESMSFVLKAKVTPQLQLGYAYDHPFGRISKLSNASHEVMVNYIFKYTESKVASPR
jgi:type IX secretion system PorP/SprF family membrane protein